MPAAERPPPESMGALRIHAEGGPEGLVYERAPTPAPAIGEVLVRVAAASFTPTELSWPSTWVDRTGRDRTPVIPGHEACGRVAALGYGTVGFDVGDAVYGLTDWYRDGAAAEYVAVEARNLAPVPNALDEVAAAAAAMPALTAWEALFERGHLEAGQTALILGAGGGVGTFAVALASAAGARVLGAARPWAREAVLELGAERFVAIDRDGLEDGLADVDVVLDLVGGDLLGSSWASLRPGGTVVSVVEHPASRPEARTDGGAVFFVVEESGAALREVAARFDLGRVRPVVGKVLPLSEGREAFLAKQGGGVAGKVVLTAA